MKGNFIFRDDLKMRQPISALCTVHMLAVPPPCSRKPIASEVRCQPREAGIVGSVLHASTDTHSGVRPLNIRTRSASHSLARMARFCLLSKRRCAGQQLALPRLLYMARK